jgi:hypothetical protein
VRKGRISTSAWRRRDVYNCVTLPPLPNERRRGKRKERKKKLNRPRTIGLPNTLIINRAKLRWCAHELLGHTLVPGRLYIAPDKHAQLATWAPDPNLFAARPGSIRERSRPTGSRHSLRAAYTRLFYGKNGIRAEAAVRWSIAARLSTRPTAQGSTRCVTSHAWAVEPT